MQSATGAIVNGKVTGITKFGAFITLEDGRTGMVHISEISTSYVKEISEHLKMEQIVKAKILNTDNGKVSLSIKQAIEELSRPKPSFEDLMSKFKTDSDEKISDLKKSFESKRGGFSKKGGAGKF